MLTFLSNLKDNIKLIATSVGLAIVAWFSFVYVRRGDKIRELELDKKDQELDNKTVKVETEIEEKTNEIKDKDKSLADKLNKFNDAAKHYRDIRGRTPKQ